MAEAATHLSYKEEESRLSAQSAHDVAAADTQISKATALHSRLLHGLSSAEAHAEDRGRFDTVLPRLRHTASALVAQRTSVWDSVGVGAAEKSGELQKTILINDEARMDSSIKAQHQEVERCVRSQKLCLCSGFLWSMLH